MSLAVLDKENRPQSAVTLYLSVDGAGALPVEALKAVMRQGGRVAIAFDADKPGELMAWRVAERLPEMERLLPSVGKDWNEQLRGIGKPNSDKSQLLELWRWHGAALKLGHSQKYMNRLREVAISFIKGEPLSRQVERAMRHDLEHSSQRTASNCSAQNIARGMM